MRLNFRLLLCVVIGGTGHWKSFADEKPATTVSPEAAIQRLKEGNARFVADPPPSKPVDRFSWPLYGYSHDHNRYFPASSKLHAPFHQI